MGNCDCLSYCPYFDQELEESSLSSKQYLRRYCLGEFDQCARHTVTRILGQEIVPPSLKPDMQQEAGKLIAG